MRIIGSNNRVARIEMTLPVDASGEFAFDEDGDPIKGKTPIVITVPRWDCLPHEQFKELMKAGEAAATADDDDRDVWDQVVDSLMTMLHPFLTPEEMTVVSRLRLFELQQIWLRIQEASTMNVGELLASSDS